MSAPGPVFAQSVLRYTATQAGLLMLPGAQASGLTMALLRSQIYRVDPLVLIALGALGMTFTMLTLANIGPDTGEASLFWPLIFRRMATETMFLPLSLAPSDRSPARTWEPGAAFTTSPANLAAPSASHC